MVSSTTLQPLHSFTGALGVAVGYAQNVSPMWAVGATIGLEAVEGGLRRVFKGRARRWWSDKVALDIEPGIFSVRDFRFGGSPWVTGGLVDTRLELGGVGYVGLRWEAMHLERKITDSGRREEVDPGGFQQGLAVGGGLTGKAGIISFVVAAAAALVVVTSIPVG